jgi:hypothetical protein
MVNPDSRQDNGFQSFPTRPMSLPNIGKPLWLLYGAIFFSLMQHVELLMQQVELLIMHPFYGVMHSMKSNLWK